MPQRALSLDQYGSWQTLIDMGWPHPCSPIQTNNLEAVGVTNKTLLKKVQNDGHETVVAVVSWLTQALKIRPITSQNIIQISTMKPINSQMQVLIGYVPRVLPQ